MAAPINIQTNVGAINVQRNLAITSRNLQRSISRLSSGIRVQSAADDPAGIAISEGLNKTIRGFKQAQRNANDAIAMLQTAEGAYKTVSDLLTRMRELAVQSANDSLTDGERTFVDTEYQALVAEIDRVSAVTEYNGITLLDGGPAGAGALLTFQIGARTDTGGTPNNILEVTLNAQDSGTLFSAAGSAGDVGTLISSQTAITDIDTAFTKLATDRSSLGANINKLTSAVDNLAVTIENLSAAKSQIKDADVTQESAGFTKNQVLMQAGVAMLAQANSTPNYALQLLG